MCVLDVYCTRVCERAYAKKIMINHVGVVSHISSKKTSIINPQKESLHFSSE